MSVKLQLISSVLRSKSICITELYSTEEAVDIHLEHSAKNLNLNNVGLYRVLANKLTCNV